MQQRANAFYIQSPRLQTPLFLLFLRRHAPLVLSDFLEIIRKPRVVVCFSTWSDFRLMCSFTRRGAS